MQVSPEVTPDMIPAARKITILGAGAWGTAVAMALAGRHDVLLWGRNGEAMAAMAASGENSYLPGFPLPPQLRISAATLWGLCTLSASTVRSGWRRASAVLSVW